MCLIVDANVAAIVFSGDLNGPFAPVWLAIKLKKAIAVHGGKLSTEYSKIVKLVRILVELGRQGSLRRVSDDLVQKETARFAKMKLQSDDPHILGLAVVSKARLLCSHDINLHADFVNPALLKPAGAVYQDASHSHLISKHCRHVKKPRPRLRRRKQRAKPKPNRGT